MTAPIRDEFRYLLVTPRDRQWGLYVTAAGSQFVPPNARFRAVGQSPVHDYLWQHGRVMHEYAIVYVIRGEAEFESKLTGKLPVRAGSVILLFPNVWHRYRPTEEVGFDSHWVIFQGDYVDRLCQQGFLSPKHPVLETGMDELILHPFTRLLDHVRSQPLGVQQLLAGDMLAIIAGTLTRRAVPAHQAPRPRGYPSGKGGDRGRGIPARHSGIGGKTGIQPQPFLSGIQGLYGRIALSVPPAIANESVPRNYCGVLPSQSNKSPPYCGSTASTSSLQSSRRKLVCHPLNINVVV